MATTSSDSRTTATAWAASLAVHSLIATGALWAGSRGGMEVGGDSPTREVGIVLRQSSQPPAPFEEPSDFETLEPVEITPIEAPAETALPPSPFSDLLNQLVEQQPEGAGPPASEGGSAGSPQPPPGGGGQPKLPISQTRVKFYGVEGVGSRFLFALDRSISMRGGPLRSAKAELIRSLEAIGPSHQFHIVFFEMRPDPINVASRGGLAFGTEENKRKAARRVMGVTANGGTDRLKALRFSLRFRPDVVFFLTDDDLPMTAADMAEIIGEAAGLVTINTVEFGQGPDNDVRDFLVELAERTGGERCYVDTSRLPR